MRIPFIKPSTRNYFRMARQGGLPLFDRLHGYIYGRFAYQYIGMAGDKKPWWRFLLVPLVMLLNRHSPFMPTKRSRTGDPAQEKPTFADTYHGKAMPLAEASKLIRLDRPVNTSVSEQVLPYTRARDIVLANPEKIVLLDCPCRSGMKNPCTPIDVCLLVGEPFCSFMLEHHPDRTRQIDADEAVRILKAENARGHVAHAFFKDVMLGRFYAICNCCACCCGAMKAQRSGVQMLCSSGYLAEVDQDACSGCGTCVRLCQFKAVGLRQGKAFIRTKRCMGCGVCEQACAKSAITLRLAPEKGEPLRVDAL